MDNIRYRDLNLLVAFDALYDERSVTRTARRLSLTQSTVSGMLARLREMFDDPLFVRVQRGIVPTPHADALAPRIKELLNEFESMFVRQSFDPKRAKSTIRVSASDYALTTMLLPAMRQLRKSSPGIRLAIRPYEIEELDVKLRDGNIDLAITNREHAPRGLPTRDLFNDRYVGVMRTTHPLAGKEVSMSDFCRYDHVLVSPTTGSFEGLTDIELRRSGRRRNVVFSVPNFNVVMDLLESDDLLAMLPGRLLADRRRQLCMFKPPVSIAPIEAVAVWHPRNDKDRTMQWFRDLLVEAALGFAGRRT